jgi:biotin carboxyl carrier protein
MHAFKYTINGNTYEVSIDSFEGTQARVTVNGVTLDVEVERQEQKTTRIERQKAVPGAGPQPERTKPQAAPGIVKSPLPGVVMTVNCKEGEAIKAGQSVAILEAMKMENEIAAVIDGTVEKVHVSPGQNVLEGDPIVTIRG